MTWTPPSEPEFNERWLTTREAEDLLDFSDLWRRHAWIMDRLITGQIVAVARTGQLRDQENSIEPFVPIPFGFWQHITDADEEHFWETGDAKFTFYDHTGYGTPRTRRFFEVRFEPEGFSGKPPRASPPQSPIPDQQPQPPDEREDDKRNKGGRPRLEFWEDLLVAMFDRLWHGGLAPQTQADIEKAMEDWLSQKRYSASERAIRDRARKLWKVWTKEGNN
jgi:hypothetical protein